jgi:hypothetical protein
MATKRQEPTGFSVVSASESAPPGSPTSKDWLVVSVEAVESAARDAHAALDTVVEMLGQAARERTASSSVQAVVAGLMERGGRDTRLAPTVAFAQFEAAVTAYRALAIRALVDEEGLSFTAVGRLTGVSRQMVARLYRSSSDRLNRLV